jgi:two-component system invasion response regulator UvrY
VIRVFVADDHPIVREGIHRILGESDDMEIVGEAASVPELFQRLDSVHPDVVILDLSMPGPDLVEALRTLRERNVRTLVLSMSPESPYARRAISAGASGYLGKELTPDELINALWHVHEGRTYLSPSLAEKLADDGTENGPGLHEQLSQRELQVLLLLGAGKTVGEISKGLGLSPKTVSTYRTRVLRKLGLRSTADLVRFVIENELD